MSISKYRPDIDGLRAIAVVPVVLYHLKIKPFDGGFVGVDIFFVISGYLITQLIYGEIQQGRYSIVGFYVRRARRIFPALFVMCAVCTVATLFILLPGEVAEFKSSLIAATLFVSNIYFYITADYFAAAAETKPLLHTWSLAVEEQFYIFFPLILLAAHRYLQRWHRQALVGLAIASLAICGWLAEENPEAAFYLIHPRAWELLIGALLAVGVVPTIRGRLLAEVIGGLGLILIAVSVFLLTENMQHLGLAMLLPCLGAACVIHSGLEQRTWTARLLSIPPMRWIGLISYSLYLWHWPITVAALTYSNPFTRLSKAIALSASIVAAVLSWRFVEQPFRQRPYRIGSAGILSLSGFAMATLVAVALVAYPISNRLWVIPERAQAILAREQKPDLDGGRCFLSANRNDFALFNREQCLGLSDTKPNVLLIGDSMAADVAHALRLAYPDVNWLQAIATRCKPVLATMGAKGCSALMNYILREFIPEHKLDAVVFSARWIDADADRLVQTIEQVKLHAGKVIVLGPRLEYVSPVPRLLAMSIIKNDPKMLDRARRAGQDDRDALYAARLEGTGVTYFSMYRTLCPSSDCISSDDDGMPLNSDYGHLTASGATYVINRLKEAGALSFGFSVPQQE